MKHWFYNAETKQETYSEEQPKGFIKGRLPYQFWSAERKKSYREKKASSKIVVRDFHKNKSLNDLEHKGFYLIYKTVNLVNGKTYIGQHKYENENNPLGNYIGSGKLLQLAIKKYGKENFHTEVLYKRIRDAETADAIEIWCIAKERSLGKAEYNISSGGQGHSGWYKPASKGKTWWTNDIEEILSFDCPEGWHKGRHLVLSDEARAKCASMKGKKHTEETKQKMREHNAMKRPEVAQKVSNKLKGRIISDKCIEAVKRANTFREPWNKGKKVQYSDEWHEKQKNKSYTQTDDFRLACSKRTKQLIWINNGEINKRINHLLPIPEGWERGRLNAFGRI